MNYQMEQKMKYLALFSMFLFLAGCYCEEVNERDLRSAFGRWRGEGTFSDAEVAKNFGRLNFDIYINRDMTATGIVGDAAIESADFGKAGGRIDIRAVLDGKVDKTKDCDKCDIIIRLEKRKKNVITGTFHLQSNFIFDYDSYSGDFTLNRR